MPLLRRACLEGDRLRSALRPLDALLLAATDDKAVNRVLRSLCINAAALAADYWQRNEAARRSCSSLERYVVAHARLVAALDLLHRICKAAGVAVKQVTWGRALPDPFHQAVDLAQAPPGLKDPLRYAEHLLCNKIGFAVVRSLDEIGVAAGAASSFLVRVGLPSRHDGEEWKSLVNALLECAWRESSPHYAAAIWPAWLPSTRAHLNLRALRYIRLSRPYWLSEDLWRAATEMMQAEWALAGEAGAEQPADAVARQMMNTRRERAALKAWISTHHAPPGTAEDLKAALAAVEHIRVEEVTARRVKDLRTRLNLSHNLQSEDAAPACYELPDPASSPEQALMQAEDLQAKLALLDKLPLRQQDVMRLRAQGYSDKDISKITGQTPTAVKTMISAARKKLNLCKPDA